MWIFHIHIQSCIVPLSKAGLFDVVYRNFTEIAHFLFHCTKVQKLHIGALLRWAQCCCCFCTTNSDLEPSSMWWGSVMDTPKLKVHTMCVLPDIVLRFSTRCAMDTSLTGLECFCTSVFSQNISGRSRWGTSLFKSKLAKDTHQSSPPQH